MSFSTLDAIISDVVRRIFAATEDELTEGIREQLNQEGFDGDEDSDPWLGRYRPMSSPGTVMLHWQRLGRLLFETARRFDIDRGSKEARLLCQVLVADVYAHEQFHFLSDIFSRIRQKPRQDHKMEEALATAWGWFYCQAMAKQIGLDPVLTENAVRFWFDEIDAPGYKRWKAFAHRCFFENGVAAHLGLTAMAASGDGRDLVRGVFRAGAGLAGLCQYQVVEGAGAGVPVFSCAGESSAFPADLMHQALSFAPAYLPAKRWLDLSEGKLSRPGLQLQEGDYDEVFLCGNPIASLGEEPVVSVIEKVSARHLCLRHCGVPDGLLSLAFVSRNPLRMADPEKLESIVQDDLVAQGLFNDHLSSKGKCVLDLQAMLIDAGLYGLASTIKR